MDDVTTKVYPSSLICSLTLELFEKPVVLPNGTTVSRPFIEEYIDREGICPFTRNPLTKEQLIPNRAIAEQVEEYLRSQTTALAAAAAPLAPPAVIELNMSEISIEKSALNKVTATLIPKQTAVTNVIENTIYLLDVSYSMIEPANQPEPGGEVDGLSKLDIAKHSMKAVIDMTKETNNIMSIVSFSTESKVISGFVETKSNHSYLNSKIDSLAPEFATNIWGALNTAIQLINASIEVKGPGKYNIVLLTDGQENRAPQSGTINMLAQTLQRSNLNVTIDVIGIGYGTDIDSTFLQGIADTGSGSFVHVSSSEFMCDALTRLTCNNSQTFGSFGTLKLTVSGTTFTDIPNYKSKKFQKISDTEIAVTVNGLRYGVPQDIVFDINESDSSINVNAEFTYLDFVTKNTETIVKEQRGVVLVEPMSDSVIRDNYCKLLYDVLTLPKDDEYPGLSLSAMIFVFAQPVTISTSDYCNAVLHEVNDQVTKALSRQDWYQKWGKHYLISILEAHTNKVAKSFASKPMSFYSTPELDAAFEEGSFIFNSLPPPSPSITVSAYAGGTFRSLSSTSAAPVIVQKPVNMQQYNTKKLDCFDGNCTVQTPSRHKKIRDLTKGDTVLTSSGNYVKIKCLVHITYQPHEREMVYFDSGLVITKYHPIFDGTWKFPKDIGETRTVICSELFNLVLESEHIVYVNDIPCVTLGHGITTDKIIMHEFFGTQKVINCLKQVTGWNDGKVNIDGEKSYSKKGPDGMISNWIIVQ